MNTKLNGLYDFTTVNKSGQKLWKMKCQIIKGKGLEDGIFKIFIDWLRQVLVVACGIFCCGLWALCCGAWPSL